MEKKIWCSLIWVNNNWKRYIVYNYDWDQKLKPDTIWYTTKNIPNEEIENIKKCSLDELDNLLSKYI